jgi:hypothetical protein
MSVRIPAALRRRRQDLSPYPDEAAVHDLRDRLGHRWRRDAILTPFTITLRFVTQVLHGNTALTHVTLKACRDSRPTPSSPGLRSRACGAGIAPSSSTARPFSKYPNFIIKLLYI